MKQFVRFILVFLFACTIITGCKPDNSNRPAIINNTPSNIIVKEKDSSGVFQIKEQYKLFQDSAHIFFDSIQIGGDLGQSTISFDYSLYITKNLAVMKFNYLPIDSNFVDVLKFENGRIVRLEESYDLIHNSSNNQALDFKYTDSILSSVNTVENTPDANWFHFGSDYSKDSVEVSSFDGGNASYNFNYRGYYISHENNTNSLLLSGYPFSHSPLIISTIHIYTSLFLFGVLPFPNLHTNLVGQIKDVNANTGFPEHIFQPTTNYIYTYDENGRVKTALVNNFGTEFLIEYNY